MYNTSQYRVLLNNLLRNQEDIVEIACFYATNE